MPILTDCGITGRIAWLGVVHDSNETLCSEPMEAVEAHFEGLEGECHSGLTRPSCVRVKDIYPREGTEIRNTRQISILSVEELADIARAMEIGHLEPAWVGANLVLEGVPALTQLPPATRLAFEGGAVLTVDVENGPCRFPAEVIEGHHPGKGRGFIKAARGRRGVTGWVERPGTLSLGATCRIFTPPARTWAPLTEG